MAGFNKQWQSISTPDLLKFFITDDKSGLTSAEAALRVAKLGSNNISYFPDIVWSLLSSFVIRDGKRTQTKNNLIALGDIVLLEKNKVVPADIRLIAVDNLSVNQSVLDGSEVAVYKNSNTTHAKYNNILSLKNMAFAGSSVTYGHAVGVVVATGGNTYLNSMEKHYQKLGRKFKKIQKNLKNNEIIINDTSDYISPKLIDTVIVNFPAPIDSVKEIIRIISHQMGKNLIFCTDESTAKRLIAITPGMAHIDKKYFEQKSNKSIMEADYPLMSFISVNSADILRFSKILNIKNRQAICLDAGLTTVLASSELITVVSAESAIDEALLRSNYLVNNFQDIKKLIHQLKTLLG